MRLYTKLVNYIEGKVYPFHMPGHKRRVDVMPNKLPYNLDITEIHGFDNLQNPEGILSSCQKKASLLYGSISTFYSINGATGGIFSAVSAVCNRGDKIIVASNCHRSVFNICEILNLRCIMLPLNIDENGIFSHFDIALIEKIIEQNGEAKCIILTSPTYEGIIVNVHKIAQLAHKNKMLLIVDEAHGSHLFLEGKSAGNKGADIVIDSIHKTLPSLTQTALLNIYTKRVNLEQVQKYVSMFNSSSPSYILMASIDECIEFLLKHGKKYYKKLKDNLDRFYGMTKNLKHLKILNKGKDFFDFDNTKITILTTKSNTTGYELKEILRKNKIEVEMAYDNYVTCITTIFDTKLGFSLLLKALSKIDSKLKENTKKYVTINFSHRNNIKIKNVTGKSKTLVNLNDSIGLISAEYVWASPPSIPIIIPGENIKSKVIEYLRYIRKRKTELFSSSGAIKHGKIYVIKNNRH